MMRSHITPRGPRSVIVTVIAVISFGTVSVPCFAAAAGPAVASAAAIPAPAPPPPLEGPDNTQWG